MDFRKLGIWILFIGLLFGVSQALPATAQGETPLCVEDGLPRHERWLMGLPCLPVMTPSSAPAPASSMGVASDQITGVVPSLADYTYLVFTSFRDGNLEIYGTTTPWDEDGIQAPTRMTTHLLVDYRPRMRPGSTQVLFASNRTGNYEVYLMDWGGSNLKQLTFSKGYDSEPAWSPDGSQIAFVSEIDANQEIMVMNADGTNLRRLTNNPTADFHPNWSPDGSRLVWVRALQDANYGVIYTMNADGSNQTAITGGLYWAENPEWSKDGTQIAFDYDKNGDRDLDLVKINVGGSSIDTILDGSGVDYLAGSWTGLLNKELLYTKISYLGGGSFSACAGVYNLVTHSSSCLGSSYLDWYPDAALVDMSVPETYVLALPEYLRAGEGVTVVGKDPGLAGIYALYAQYRYGVDGEWQDLGVSFYETRHTFPYWGQPGDTVYFRSRGLDWAENLEPYPAGDGDAQSMVYAWQLDGKVTDNRAAGIPDAQAFTGPVFADQDNADSYGQFHRYVPTSAVSVALSQDGYAALPDTALFSRGDLAYSWVLPPQDNQVINSDFEAGLEGWTVLGDPGVSIDASIVHSGYAAVSLGMADNETADEPSTGTGEVQQSLASSISQAMVISDTMHQPTLSFFLLGYQEGSGSEFDLRVNDTLVYSATVVPVAWEHAWVDLAPWSGQAVTVTFTVSSDPELGFLQLHLDDISLGSWLSPVVEQVSPAEVEAGTDITLTITGQNFIATPKVQIGATLFSDVTYVDEHTLQLTVTAGLAPGLYEVRVINPGGQAGVWQERLQVGEVLYLPTVWKN